MKPNRCAGPSQYCLPPCGGGWWGAGRVCGRRDSFVGVIGSRRRRNPPSAGIPRVQEGPRSLEARSAHKGEGGSRQSWQRHVRASAPVETQQRQRANACVRMRARVREARAHRRARGEWLFGFAIIIVHEPYWITERGL